MRQTIEPAADGGINVYNHGTYGRSSVLHGQAKRSFEAYFKTQDEAIGAFPRADVLEHSSKPFRTGNETLGELSGLPRFAPGWFDPANAGEHWGEDDW